MASNTTLNTGAGGDIIATKERTHDGDATKVQVVSLAGVTGSEGSYTFADINGDATNGLDVDVTRSALPTGASTSANQTTIIGHLDGVEGLLTTIDTDTGAMLTSLQTIDNAIAGNEMQVDIVSGGIAGKVDDAAFTAATDEGVLFMAVASSDSVDSGDAGAVAMTTARALHTAVQSLPASTNTIEVVGDAATDAAVSGNPLYMGGRASTATPTAMSADNDVVPVWLTRNGASVVAGDLVDDAAFTPGTSRVQAIGLQADETATDSVDEGDIGAPRMSLDRKQYVIAHAETSSIYQNGTARTPVFAAIDAATSGDNTLLAAQGAGNKIRVHQLFLVAAGTTTVRFESGAGGTALTGQMNLVANTGFVLPYSPIGWFETAANTLLNLELSAAVSVDGNFAYTVVT